jgi:hypothetical protein
MLKDGKRVSPDRDIFPENRGCGLFRLLFALN